MISWDVCRENRNTLLLLNLIAEQTDRIPGNNKEVMVDMKKRLSILLILVMIFSISAWGGVVHALGTTYYVSSSGGNDNNNGTSVNTPWQSLSKTSSITFQAGDTICLKAGDTWQENLTLHGNGTSVNPIRLTSYGTGPRPILKRRDEVGSHVVDLHGLSGWEISDLEISDAEKGIYLDYHDTFGCDYIKIENCYFHDIYQKTH